MVKVKEDTQPIEVRVPDATYSIYIEDGLLQQAGERLQNIADGRKVFIVSDNNVWPLWGQRLLQGLRPLHPQTILVPPGERLKRLSAVEKICDQLAALGAERSSLLLAFGGGVVGDMAGFAAAVYLRGIDCVQIPTTLLAQVDSAIGGKTGVDLRIGKNLVGAFHQPKMVLADPRVLRTLPVRELHGGLFEALKCGVIGDPALFEYMMSERAAILKGRPEALTHVIRSSVALKAKVVSEDEKEGGLRRILNYGHTIGHALEAVTNYKRFLHGEAVAWGMLAANRLAMLHSVLSPKDATEINQLIRAYGPIPPIGRRIDFDAVCHHMSTDKKVRDGKINFVLPVRIGETTIEDRITKSQIIDVLRDLSRSNPFRKKLGGEWKKTL